MRITASLRIFTISSILLYLLFSPALNAQPARELKGKEKKEFLEKIGKYKEFHLGRDSIIRLKPVNDSVKVAFALNNVTVIVSGTTLREEVRRLIDSQSDTGNLYFSNRPLEIYKALDHFLKMNTKGSSLALPDRLFQNLLTIKSDLIKNFILKGEAEI